jgi:hypothetical protein
MLERVGGRAKPADDAFDRLERLRQRRQRNRRIATAVFAFVIAISGSFAAFEAFRGSNGSAAIRGTGPFYALWPELTLADAQQSQAAVDGGAGAWRLDARTTTGRFVALTLGWSDFAVTMPDGTNLDGPGPVTLDVSTLAPPCPSPLPGTEGPMNCGPQWETVTLERLVRQDATGIWSVTDVEGAFPSSDNVLSFPFAPGDTVVSGQEVSIPFVVPDGLTAVAGYTYIGKCGSSTAFENVKQDNSEILFRVAGSTFKESCTSNGSGGSSSSGPGRADLNVAIDGYVFVLASHDLDLASGWDPFTGGEPLPRDTSVVALAAVPVHFVPVPSPTPAAAAAPDVAEVACDGTTTQVLTPEVAAQPDGVHIRVTNTSSQDLSLEFRDFGGDNAPVGKNEVVWPFPPGTVELRCMDPYLDNGTPDGYVTLEVVDQNGIYHPLALECADGAVGGSPSYAEGARGWEGDPVDIVREHGIGLLPSDDVSYAGYPKQQQPQVRVVREGAVVGVFEFFDDGHGGWLMGSYQACGDAGVGLAARR